MQHDGSARRARKPQTIGLETRQAADGRTHYRASVRIPRTNKKARGHWTPNLAQARSERAILLARQEALGEQAKRPTLPTVERAADDFLTRAEEGKA